VRRLLIASWIVVASITLFAAFPAPSGYINDFASVLNDSDESYLETFQNGDPPGIPRRQPAARHRARAEPHFTNRAPRSGGVRQGGRRDDSQ